MNVNFDLKDLVYLAFKRPEKVVKIIGDNFNVEMDDFYKNNNRLYRLIRVPDDGLYEEI